MIYIVGSGPSGISCAFGLIAKGHEVTMLDAGVELEPSRQILVDQLKKQKFENWDPNLIGQLKMNTDSDVSGIPMKYSYGSDFPFQGVNEFSPVKSEDVDCLPTFAKAGFSNIWGANVLPYRAEDMLDWPISNEDLTEHYQSVFEFMDLAACEDDLNALLPLHSKRFQPLRPCRQAKNFLNDLNLNKEKLNQRGIIFGQSRLALRVQSNEKGTGCVYCGLCMYGCPYELIYNTSSSLQQLMNQKNFHYLKNVVVEKLVESGSQVLILAESRIDESKQEFTASRVYLACGPLSTTRILLESMEQYDVPLTLKDSQYFLLPCIRYQGVENLENERLHTLSQLYFELLDSDLGEHLIHLQFYMYNDLYMKAIKKIIGSAYFVFRGLTNSIVSRLMVIQGYLHSQYSPTITVSLEAGKNGKRKLVLKSNPNPRTRELIQKIIKKLFENRDSLKMILITPLLQIAKAGRGYHTGGSFPMSSNPSRFQSDRWGRPYGFQLVHAVDSTIFPSIPATTITLTAMANAHRIASNFDQYGR